MKPQDKKWIDAQTYETLLHHWRHAPVGAALFQGDTGDYYAKVMKEKRAALAPGEAVAASKAVGWEKQ